MLVGDLAYLLLFDFSDLLKILLYGKYKKRLDLNLPKDFS